MRLRPYIPSKDYEYSVQLNVFDANDRAKKCYLNAGFVEDSVSPNVFPFMNESWGRCHMVVLNDSTS